MVELIVERIKGLEKEVATYREILNVRNDRGIRHRYNSAIDTIRINVDTYKAITGKEYQAHVYTSVKGLSPEWKVKKGAKFRNGDVSRELYLNGYLYKNMITVTEAMAIMEALT